MKFFRSAFLFLFGFAFITFASLNCGNESKDSESDPTVRCPGTQSYNAATDRCVDPDTGTNRSDTDDATADETDGPDPDTTPPGDTNASNDSETETDSGSDIPVQCDEDNDGAKAEECGGNDCDDSDPNRYPGNTEQCNDVDQNCKGGPTDGLTCEFYAHSGEKLYAVDPFRNKATEVKAGLPNLLDIDTAPDGTLMGVNKESLYKFDRHTNEWEELVQLDDNIGDANGMAIDNAGTVFISAENKIFTINPSTGEVDDRGEIGEFYSSGDCVVSKDGSLAMTSKHNEDEDHLVFIDREQNKGSSQGGIGFSDVFGLTFAWGNLYGLTVNGELIKINPRNGDGTLLHTFENIRWYGAASAPEE